MTPKLSVIIPTRNRAWELPGCLSSLLCQTFPADDFEVLVVDNGSTDNTKEVVSSFQGKISNIRYFYEETPGLHQGRHRGMKEAHSNILVYADDDIEAFPSWLEGVWESFLREEVVLVGGNNLPKFQGIVPDWIWRMWNEPHPEGHILGYLSILDLGKEIKEISPFYVYGCNFSIRKSILWEAKGFHPDGMPSHLIRFRGDGESYISRYIEEKGYKSLFHPKATVYHLVPPDRTTKEYFCKRAYSQGISASFTQIRKMQNESKLDKIIKKNRQTAGFLLRRILHYFRSFYEKDEAKQIQLAIHQSYISGFLYHQKQVAQDPQLLEWVLRKEYF